MKGFLPRTLHPLLQLVLLVGLLILAGLRGVCALIYAVADAGAAALPAAQVAPQLASPGGYAQGWAAGHALAGAAAVRGVCGRGAGTGLAAGLRRGAPTSTRAGWARAGGCWPRRRSSVLVLAPHVGPHCLERRHALPGLSARL
ncbi:MAG: hypothetical protein WKG07_26695 [Hymenobacter sp.]